MCIRDRARPEEREVVLRSCPGPRSLVGSVCGAACHPQTVPCRMTTADRILQVQKAFAGSAEKSLAMDEDEAVIELWLVARAALRALNARAHQLLGDEER